LGLYADLLGQGWKMQDIDEMDVLYFLEVLAYRAKHGKEGGAGKAPRAKAKTMGDIWPFG
jgi:hypothetical protein